MEAFRGKYLGYTLPLYASWMPAFAGMTGIISGGSGEQPVIPAQAGIQDFITQLGKHALQEERVLSR